ncbi:chymotrypsin-2-like [Drosophila innubila]|uniref:chymotrypsin-2-like n=1 Tax=Drosophila innubila TaxID=198719 RepID=UPI00148B8C8A|nr:chymotrypsin-2-like [Drosophila innubila]
MPRVTGTLGTTVLLLLTIASVGVYAAPPIGRVVNGTDARVENYPFVISLRGSTGSHSCGGSIISQQFVMTAAHCTDGRRPDQLSVQYGVTDISAKGPNVVGVKRIIQHEAYNPYNNYANDIALIQVAVPFEFDYKTVAPVQLPALNFATPQLAEGGAGELIGWGLNATGGKVQTTLQQVPLKVYSDEECSLRHRGATDPRYHICGGVDEGGKGQCSGDSGGPLLFNGQQVGIVSWSIKPCAVAPYPGVYCRVASYIDWIQKNQIILA